MKITVHIYLSKGREQVFEVSCIKDALSKRLALIHANKDKQVWIEVDNRRLTYSDVLDMSKAYEKYINKIIKIINKQKQGDNDVL